MKNNNDKKSKTNNLNKTMKETEIFIDVSKIVQDDAFRCRVQDDKDTIEDYTTIFREYKEAKEPGESPVYPFPEIWVWKEDDKYVLITGYHRLAAARQAGLDKIHVKIFTGTKEEAVLLAMRDNQKHGLRLSRGDLKYCIEKVLELFPDKSHAVIAEMLGCSRQYVSKVATSCHLPEVEKRVGRDNKEYSTTRKTTKKHSNMKGVKAKKQENANVPIPGLSMEILEPVDNLPIESVPPEPANDKPIHTTQNEGDQIPQSTPISVLPPVNDTPKSQEPFNADSCMKAAIRGIEALRDRLPKVCERTQFYRDMFEWFRYQIGTGKYLQKDQK